MVTPQYDFPVGAHMTCMPDLKLFKIAIILIKGLAVTLQKTLIRPPVFIEFPQNE